MAKKANRSFWVTANAGPSVVTLGVGFFLMLVGVAYPSYLATVTVDVSGFVLILSGIIGIFLLRRRM